MGKGIRLWAGLLLLALLLTALPVQAENGASLVQNQSTFSADGTCEVSINVMLHLESAISNLEFPLPADATGITVNGGRAKTRRSGSVRAVDLSGLVTGPVDSFSLMLHYSLPDGVTQEESERLMLTLPLLSGFSYPISEMRFSITLPGEVTGRPAFSSGYRLSSIEENITYTVEGSTISGQVTGTLMDRETLTMTLEVTPEMFPQEAALPWQIGLDDLAMYVCAGLAFLYWLLFLRCLPPRRVRRSTPPEGLTAGELGAAITGQGTDLTMMVMTWAQLGYILIHVNRDGVDLHKRMEMGNERSAYENRCFRLLFGNRRVVSGSGYGYAMLHRRLRQEGSGRAAWFLRSSGNPRILRVLAAGVGLFGGMSLGAALGDNAPLTGLLVFFLCVLGAVSAWTVQAGAYCLFLHDKDPLLPSLGCMAGWLILGAFAGELLIAAGVLGAQVLAGLAAAYSGRRSEQGSQVQSQVFGLRHYLKTVDREELRRICRQNPEYFFSLAPYALALGVEKAFAGRFGPMRLPGCPYLTTGLDGHRTAKEWAELMKQAVAALDEKQKRLPYEQAMSGLLSLGGGRPRRRRREDRRTPRPRSRNRRSRNPRPQTRHRHR